METPAGRFRRHPRARMPAAFAPPCPAPHFFSRSILISIRRTLLAGPELTQPGAQKDKTNEYKQNRRNPSALADALAEEVDRYCRCRGRCRHRRADLALAGSPPGRAACSRTVRRRPILNPNEKGIERHEKVHPLCSGRGGLCRRRVCSRPGSRRGGDRQHSPF